MPTDRRVYRLTMLNSLLIILLGAVVLQQYLPWPRVGLDPLAPARSETPRGALAEYEKTAIDIFRRDSPSVVHINALVSAQRDGTRLDITQITKDTGSGFIWDKQGHVVTNYHVIQGADAAQVVLSDQSRWPGHLVGADPDQDIAVLSIDAPAAQLEPFELGDSKSLEVGQAVFAIGNPFGLDQSLTTGIVSALGRQMESVNGRTIHNVIQTDAAINPGSSGGPLLDSAGRLIGMNSSIVSPSGAFAGIGFAIPVDELQSVVTQLIRQGKVTRPSIGVTFGADQWSQYLGLPGVIVVAVAPGSPAEKAGVQAAQKTADGEFELGDVIVSLGGDATPTADRFLTALEKQHVGDKLSLALLHDGQQRTVQVVLSASD